MRWSSDSNQNIFVVPYPDGESLEDDDSLELLPGDEGEHPRGEQGAARHDEDCWSLLSKTWGKECPLDSDGVAMCPLQADCWPRLAICPVVASVGQAVPGTSGNAVETDQASDSIQNVET